MNIEEVRRQLIKIREAVDYLLDDLPESGAFDRPEYVWDSYPVEGQCWCCHQHKSVFRAYRDGLRIAVACDLCREHYH